MNDTPEELTTVDGTVKSIVFRNDENGFTILHVTLADDGRFRLAQREVTVLGTCAAAWEGEEGFKPGIEGKRVDSEEEAAGEWNG